VHVTEPLAYPPGSARPMPLRQLLCGLGGAALGPWEGTMVRGIQWDSRRVEPGDLFVALLGQRQDGNLFLADALRRGAVAVVTSRASLVPPGVPALVHPAPGSILAQVSARLYDFPARAVRCLGITGTNGKTTTTLLTAHLLQGAGLGVAHWTTTQVQVGDTRFRPRWTTPWPPDLHRFLAQARDSGQGWAVLEVSSHALAMGRLEGVRFAAVAVTNVTPDHLDFHGSFAAYAAAKASLLRYVGEDGFGLLCADDPVARTFPPPSWAPVYTYGLASQAHVTAQDVVLGKEGSRFALVVEDETLAHRLGVRRLELSLPLVGRHNVQNALAACVLALSQGVPPQAVARTLPSFTAPPRRLERRQIGPYTILNDVAMNEASYETVLAAVEALRPSQLVVVHALGGNRGPEVNARVVRTLARFAPSLGFAPLLATLSQDVLKRYGPEYQVTPEEAQAAQEAAREAGLDMELFPHLEEAVTRAIARLRPGGTLLLLGTFGMDDGPGMAEDLLCRRLGLPPPPRTRYPDPAAGFPAGDR
jgi:UDP-N-acetylmuramoyl-L-alanyl-D-glutamate--2,6-diaminopimelate ligase